MRDGLTVFSPIAHSHSIAQMCDLPTTYAWWSTQDDALLQRCDELYVLTLRGWDMSEGVSAEIELAKLFGLPVKYLPPNENERKILRGEDQ